MPLGVSVTLKTEPPQESVPLWPGHDSHRWWSIINDLIDVDDGLIAQSLH
jgi:hypothetical protein